MSSSYWRAGLIAGTVLVSVPALSHAAAAKTYPMVIRQMAFSPTPAGLRVGDVVEWVNDDIFLHSATSKDGGFDVTLKPKSHVRMALTRAGSFVFSCRYHPGMKGRLVVAK